MDRILVADILVTVHLAFVLFVVIGQILIVAGRLLRWEWVRNFWFRTVHLLSIGVVAGQAVLRIECPLTTWERSLRGELHDLENASAVGRAAHDLLYYPYRPRLFLVLYLAFAVLVLLTWVFVPPRWPGARGQESGVRDQDKTPPDS